MRRWIAKLPPGVNWATCSQHRDRVPVAALVRRSKVGPFNVNMRYYCQECLDRKIAKDPKIPVY